MSFNTLNIIKSYITDVLLESHPSRYSGRLDLFLSKGRLQLCSPNAIYSYADKYDNFRDSLSVMDLSFVKDVLILGFGTGSISYIMEKKLGLDCTYTGVEIDPVVIGLASRFVLPSLRSSITLAEADAALYIQLDRAHYDLICIDIFVDTSIPSVFLTPDFLADVMDSLTPKGQLMFNHLYLTEVDKAAADDYYSSVFSKIVGSPQMMLLRTNAMMIGQKI